MSARTELQIVVRKHVCRRSGAVPASDGDRFPLMRANRFAALDREHDFDDEEWDLAWSEVEAGLEQVGICSRE
eukprot:95526-Amphidinium_carterae.1